MSNKILVLTGVSGVGKTTMANLLKEKYDFKSSVSYTTRPIRPNEINGIDYNFISQEEFLSKLDDGFFLEYDQLFGNYYGTSRHDIEQILQINNVVFTLSTYGYLHLKKSFNERTIGFYLLPPSESELIQRMSTRNSSSIELKNRLKDIYTQSQKEAPRFDYIIEPNSIEHSLKMILKTFKNT